MKTFVVNLARRPDRRDQMERTVPVSWAAEYTTGWVGPLDGQTITLDQLAGYGLFPWQMESDNMWWNRPLKLGEIGCAVSHLMCWKAAAAVNSTRTLVLEDDVELTDECDVALRGRLADLEALDPEWDLVYLGRWPQGPDQPVATGIVRPGYSYCTFAYMLSATGLTKVLASDFEQALIPVDELLPALYMDHPREDVRRRYPRRLNAYAFEPALVTQRPKGDAGSDTETSAFVDPVAIGSGR